MRKGVVSFILILSIITFYSCAVYAGEWALTYGGANYDRANSVQQTADGRFIVAGWTGSYGAGGDDIWVLKLDAVGMIMWERVFGGTGTDWANSIQLTADGGYIVAGATDSFGAGSDDGLILKLDDNGAVSWQKTYGGTGAIFFHPLVRPQTADMLYPDGLPHCPQA